MVVVLEDTESRTGPTSCTERRSIHGVHQPRIQVPIHTGAVESQPFKVAARVGPIEGRDQALRTEQQLLPSDAKPHRFVISLQNLQINEGVLQVPAVLVDPGHRQIVAVDRGVDHLDIDAHPVGVLEVHVVAPAEQVIGRVTSRTEWGAETVPLVHVPMTEFATNGDLRVLGDVPWQDAVEWDVLQVFAEQFCVRCLLVAEVVVKEHRLPRLWRWRWLGSGRSR